MGKLKQKWVKNGTEDQFLQKLIKQGKVTEDTTPKYLKDTYPEKFGKHSTYVIRNHLNVAKTASGMFCKIFVLVIW